MIENAFKWAPWSDHKPKHDVCSHVNIFPNRCPSLYWQSKSCAKYKICSAKPHSTLIRVADLRNGNQWNENLINELFSLAEICSITSIQIRKEPCQDRWMWQFTNKCVFTVKSAYHAQVQNLSSSAASSSSSLNVVSTTTWKDLWKTQCMPKVRNFLWKSLHNKWHLGWI